MLLKNIRILSNGFEQYLPTLIDCANRMLDNKGLSGVGTQQPRDRAKDLKNILEHGLEMGEMQCQLIVTAFILSIITFSCHCQMLS